MKRNFKDLDQISFDVLVIGGGIYGAWTAYDAALRGLKVALVEKGDWASGTSSNSSKLLHGGLRYLEQLHFGMVRKSLEERRLLFSLAPHQVTPLRFAIPIYRGRRVGRTRLRAGLWLYDMLAGSGQPVDRHGWFGRELAAEHYPFLQPAELDGTLTYGDCQIDDARFVVEIVDGAAAAGAAVVNYAAATRLIVKNGRVAGARVSDTFTGDAVDVLASVVVNAAGPWTPRITEGHDNNSIRLSKGVHLVMPALDTTDALLIMAKRDRRVFFMIPWFGRTLLGTTDSDYAGDLDNIRVEDGDVDYLLGEANAVLKTQWDASAILGRFAGVRALKFEPGKSPDSVTREWVLRSPQERLLVSTGGKYTSARSDAAEIVDRAQSILGTPVTKTEPTAVRGTPWNPGHAFEAWRSIQVEQATRLGVDAETAAGCTRYGRRMEEVLRLVESNPDLAKRIHPELPFAGAEIVWVAAHGMVATLEDILRRRLPVLVLCRVDRPLLERAADLAAPVLGWTPQRRQNEIEETLRNWGV